MTTSTTAGRPLSSAGWMAGTSDAASVMRSPWAPKPRAGGPMRVHEHAHVLAGVAGVHDHDAVRGQRLAHRVRHHRRQDRARAVIEQALALLVPLAAQLRYAGPFPLGGNAPPQAFT